MTRLHFSNNKSGWCYTSNVYETCVFLSFCLFAVCLLLDIKYLSCRFDIIISVCIFMSLVWDTLLGIICLWCIFLHMPKQSKSDTILSLFGTWLNLTRLYFQYANIGNGEFKGGTKLSKGFVPNIIISQGKVHILKNG